MDEADYLAEAAAATDQVRAEEKDVLYQLNAFEQVKRYLIGEYHSLNRITAARLVAYTQEAGLHIERCELGQVPVSSVPAPAGTLSLARPAHAEIRLLLRKPSPRA
jgi:hypothetical protein